MADVNDTHNTKGRLENEWVNLKGVDTTERTRQAITNFTKYRRDIDDNSDNTHLSDLGNLRCTIERAECPLLKMSVSDVRKYKRKLAAPKEEDGYGMEADGSGIYGYSRALKMFFKFLNTNPKYERDYSFFSEIELPAMDAGSVDREDLFTEKEVEEMKQAAKHPRERALVEFLADTCLRKSAALQLRVGDVHGLDSKRAYFAPNPDGVGQKGLEERVDQLPIMRSKAELRVYLNRYHPDPDNPMAPLWAIKQGYDESNPSPVSESPRHRSGVMEATRSSFGSSSATLPGRPFVGLRIGSSTFDERASRTRAGTWETLAFVSPWV